MNTKKVLEIGGIVAGVILIAFGVAAIVLGVNGFTTVRDSIKDEQIYFGSSDDPAVAKYAPDWAEQQVSTGDQARAFAQIMRFHTLESTSGKTYSQMGRYKAAEGKGDDGVGGTNDATKAAMDEETGQPLANPARDLWVTETALTTALNTSYMAERVAVFGLVVGCALLLSGIGFLILALAVLGGAFVKEEAPAVTARPQPMT